MFKTNEEIRLNLWNLKIKPLDLKNKVHKQHLPPPPIIVEWRR